MRCYAIHVKFYFFVAFDNIISNHSRVYYRSKRPYPTLGIRGLFLAFSPNGLFLGLPEQRAGHNRDLKPETAQEKPLAPRVALSLSFPRMHVSEE